MEENEDVIGGFLKEHPEFSVAEAEQEKFFESGRREHTMRLWPHKLAGEGQFIAKLKKAGTLESTETLAEIYVNPNGSDGSCRTSDGNGKEKKKGRKAADDIGPCRAFLREELGLSDAAYAGLEKRGIFLPFGEQVYLVPRQMIPLKGLKVIRPGLHLGTNKKNRFEPSHALALYLSPEMVQKHYEMTKEQAESYLRGETFACGESASGREQKGWTLLTISGYAAGFGKAGNGQMKNHYPKGLRKERTILCQNG